MKEIIIALLEPLINVGLVLMEPIKTLLQSLKKGLIWIYKKVKKNE
jgi:hypothetical protein